MEGGDRRAARTGGGGHGGAATARGRMALERLLIARELWARDEERVRTRARGLRGRLQRNAAAGDVHATDESTMTAQCRARARVSKEARRGGGEHHHPFTCTSVQRTGGVPFGCGRPFARPHGRALVLQFLMWPSRLVVESIMHIGRQRSNSRQKFEGGDYGRRQRARGPAGVPTRSPTQLHVALGHWLATPQHPR